MFQIFISYAFEYHVDLAGRIRDRLMQEGYKPYYDQSDMEHTKKFPPQLQVAVENCTDFIVLIREGTLSHSWVLKEIEIAFMHRKNIIVVSTDGFKMSKVSPDDLPETIKDLVEFTPINLDYRRFDEFMNVLISNLQSIRIQPLENKNTEKNKKERREERLNVLTDKQTEINYSHIETILKHYVDRRIFSYMIVSADTSLTKTKYKTISTNLKEIRAEILRPRKNRNIVFVGPGGSGKSTSLKWLYLNTDKKGYSSLYLNHRSFVPEPMNLMDLFEAIKSLLARQNSSCLVFIDGLDEFACIKGEKNEFDQVVDFIDQQSSYKNVTGRHKFILATRPEHFHLNMYIRQKKARKNLDNYHVYEFLPLSKEESYHICTSIKHLSKLSQKEKYSSFADKWPTKSHNQFGLGEREYLKKLKQYLSQTDEKSSLLSSPLLCRYAYQIICEWCENGIDSDRLNTRSEQLRTVLNICLKWEYHDTEAASTHDETEKKKLEDYQNKVFSFLCEIAGRMDGLNALPWSEWNELRTQEELKQNAALCVLEEINSHDENNLAFAHQAFFDYFSASYYAEKIRSLTEDQLARLKTMLSEKVSFGRLFVEQLTQFGDELVRKVCRQIVEEYQQLHMHSDMETGFDPYDYLYSLFLGKVNYIFSNKPGFLVEDFFAVFPYGRLMLAGNVMDSTLFEEFCAQGILTVSNIEYLSSIDFRNLSRNVLLRGVVVFLNPEDIQTISFYFCYLPEFVWDIEIIKQWKPIRIAGFSRAEPPERIVRQILNISSVRERIENGESLSEILRQDENVKAFFDEYEDRIDEENEEESYYLSEKLIIPVALQMDFQRSSYKGCWCIYSKHAIHFLIQCEENVALLMKMIQEEPNSIHNAILSFDTYDLYLHGDDSFSERVKCIQNNCIKFQINAEDTPSSDNNYKWDNYFRIHWNNTQIAEWIQESKSDILQETGITAKLKKSIRWIDEFKEKQTTDKDMNLELAISDEELALLMFMSDISMARAEAERTLALCFECNHLIGKEFREIILSEKEKEARQFALDFILHYTWTALPEN